MSCNCHNHNNNEDKNHDHDNCECYKRGLITDTMEHIRMRNEEYKRYSEDNENTHEGKCILCRAPADSYKGYYICDNCRSKFAKELKYAKDLDGMNELVDGASMLISGLSKLYGIDPNDDNFRDTPYRVARLMMEMNYGNNIQAAKDVLTVSFPTEAQYDGLVSANNIHVSSLCPHHMVVVDYDVSIAYIPNGGRYVGLSKLPRLAKVLAKSMCLQEDYTMRIVEVLQEVLKPAGCAAYVKGVHNCIQARGAEMRDISNVTIALRGVFAMNPTLKEEWLFTIKDSHK